MTIPPSSQFGARDIEFLSCFLQWEIWKAFGVKARSQNSTKCILERIFVCRDISVRDFLDLAMFGREYAEDI
jgi:hypothetical protein